MAKILIVDDSWLIRQSLKTLLAPIGYSVEEAVNGVEGLEKIIEYEPDCILLDLLMPELDGFGVLDAMNEKNLKNPVIVLTADIQDTSREKCIKLGVFGFVNKPPKDDELKDMLARAVEQDRDA